MRVAFALALLAVSTPPSQAQEREVIIPGIAVQRAFEILQKREAEAARERLTEVEKRKLLVSHIRAATDCIARFAKSATGEADPARVLSAISEGVAQCRDPIATMTAEHDRLYGPGTGQAFVNGAYLKDLPRAVLARVSSPKAATPVRSLFAETRQEAVRRAREFIERNRLMSP